MKCRCKRIKPLHQIHIAFKSEVLYQAAGLLVLPSHSPVVPVVLSTRQGGVETSMVIQGVSKGQGRSVLAC